MLTLSLIIPVYNEEHHIRACLDAVAAQTVPPDEVIVVDNNCTDRTIDIVREFSFVTIIEEKQQGQVYARSAGFTAARGDILGRIDADCRIAPNWVAVVKGAFASDDKLMGTSGLGLGWIVPTINAVKSTFGSRAYFWFAHAGFNTITMWGANMAIRRLAWEQVRTRITLNDPLVHEDQDVSLWIASYGGKIVQNNEMIITTNGQGYRYLPKLFRYIRMYSHTRRLHKRNGNLSSQSTPKLGFWITLPGRVLSVFSVGCLILVSIMFFPVDFVVKKFWPKSWWLD